MQRSVPESALNRVTLAGLIITLGIVYGDIGTSPLYVVKAITSGAEKFDKLLVYGGLSCVLWTLTLQTTLKYIIITLRADNHGEGGIFALFALLKRKSTWVTIITMTGGCALLADGIITPAITVTSSVEGLRLLNPEIKVLPIVLFILVVLFFIQQFGTRVVGQSFGPVMVIWFTMLASLGVGQIIHYPEIIKVVNPVYAIDFLVNYPGGFILLGAVFLCTTGAEALYSDLGHCGIKNIRMSWIFVKTSLFLNYMGQGAWLMEHTDKTDLNPFYAIMPSWFIIPGIAISTAAAIIASQALISGSFTLISEAVSLNFWPKIKILHPTIIKGQVYIPFINWLLMTACCFIVIFFRESLNMEAAYGLSITITMIMTTMLLIRYLRHEKVHTALLVLIALLFGTIEGSFLIANLHKFSHGGWLSMALGLVFFIVMTGWFFGRRIKNRHISFTNLEQYYPIFKDLSKDETIPPIATNLVYLIKANDKHQVESKVLYSIFSKQPKRAGTYWLLHVNITNRPGSFNYEVTQLIPGVLIRIDFHLGFKIEPLVSRYFKEVLKEMVDNGEIRLNSLYRSMNKHSLPGDFLFVNVHRIMPLSYDLTTREKFILSLYTLARLISISEVKSLGLDPSSVIEEKIPIIVERPLSKKMRRLKNKQ